MEGRKMNIQQAKEEIINTVKIYTAKDREGHYRIPPIHQRPLLLIGPPGIGKTAIVRQAAEECGVGLVAYTITHHTRQSAVGLPVIREKDYQGRQVQVTEYTMSEIIASAYECMENQQVQEGILFIDEINCVSETLAPTMLQFLQNKTFGTHRVPRGWIIVAAGNPPEYNKSAKTFDIVTLDRVKSIRVEIDFPAWKQYASGEGIHGAVLAYLSGKPQNFYYIEQGRGDREFVTARGWEDLSVLLYAYEEEKIPVGEDTIREYIHCGRIAGDFAAFYRLYLHYRRDYDPAGILKGGTENNCRQRELFRQAGADERYGVMEMLLGGLTEAFRDCLESRKLLDREKELYGRYRSLPEKPGQRAEQRMEEFLEDLEQALRVKDRHRLISEEDLKREETVQREFRGAQERLRERRAVSPAEAEAVLGQWMDEKEQVLSAREQEAGEMLERAFAFLEDTLEDGPEMGYFMTALTRSPASAEFLNRHPSPACGRHLQALAVTDEEEELRRRIKEASGIRS